MLRATNNLLRATSNLLPATCWLLRATCCWCKREAAAFTPAQHVARNEVASCLLCATCCLKQLVARNLLLVARNMLLVRATCCSATCCASVNAALHIPTVSSRDVCGSIHFLRPEEYLFVLQFFMQLPVVAVKKP